MIDGLTRANSKLCGKMSDAREELNILVTAGKIQSGHSIKSLKEWDQSHMT